MPFVNWNIELPDYFVPFEYWTIWYSNAYCTLNFMRENSQITSPDYGETTPCVCEVIYIRRFILVGVSLRLFSQMKRLRPATG